MKARLAAPSTVLRVIFMVSSVQACCSGENSAGARGLLSFLSIRDRCSSHDEWVRDRLVGYPDPDGFRARVIADGVEATFTAEPRLAIAAERHERRNGAVSVDPDDAGMDARSCGEPGEIGGEQPGGEADTGSFASANASASSRKARRSAPDRTILRHAGHRVVGRSDDRRLKVVTPCLVLGRRPPVTTWRPLRGSGHDVLDPVTLARRCQRPHFGAGSCGSPMPMGSAFASGFEEAFYRTLDIAAASRRRSSGRSRRKFRPRPRWRRCPGRRRRRRRPGFCRPAPASCRRNFPPCCGRCAWRSKARR